MNHRVILMILFIGGLLVVASADLTGLRTAGLILGILFISTGVSLTLRG